MKKIFSIALVFALMSTVSYAGSKFNGNYTEPVFNARKVVTKTAAYTATVSDDYIKVTTSTANLTITLPAISTLGTNGLGSKGYKILKTDATGYHVIVSPSSTANTIDGTTGYRITKQNDFIIFSATAGSTNWKVSYADEIMSVDVASGAVVLGGTMAMTVATEATTATDTLTASQCGSTIFLNSATEFVTTLPLPTAGCAFTIVVKAAPASASYTVVTNGSSNVIYGSVIVNGAVIAGVTEDTITFTDGAAAIGDMVELIADGTNWYVTGDGVAATAITLTAT